VARRGSTRRRIVLARAAVIVIISRLREHDLDPASVHPRRRRLPDDRFVQEVLREDEQFVPTEHAGAGDLGDEPGGGPAPAQVGAQQECSVQGARLSVSMVVAEQETGIPVIRACAQPATEDEGSPEFLG